MKYEAASAMIRLRGTGEWGNNGHITGHWAILDQLSGYYVTDSDCDRISERSVTTLFDTLIPDKESWLNENFLGDRPGIHFFTDGSKLDGRTGLGFCVADLDIRKCFRLPDHNTVFQAEVMAITECIKQANIMGLAGDISIFTDSQAAIRALSRESVVSMTILRCKEEINNFSSRGRIKIIWVSGHCGIVGNEMANRLARGGSSLELVTLGNAKPFQALREELTVWAETMQRTIWENAGVG